MNNKGGNSSEINSGASEVFGASAEMLPGEKADFEDFVNQREDLKPNMEMPAELIDASTAPEVGGEQQSNAMPAANDKSDKDDDAKKDDAVKEELDAIKVPRDAEKLPAAYEKAVSKIVSRNSKDPHRMVSEMDIARWDLMKKAFARNRGDGLNGTGAA